MKQALQGEGGFDERPRSDPDAGCHRSLERAVSASTVFQTVPREVATHSPPQMAAPQARGRLLDSPGTRCLQALGWWWPGGQEFVELSDWRERHFLALGLTGSLGKHV